MQVISMFAFMYQPRLIDDGTNVQIGRPVVKTNPVEKVCRFSPRPRRRKCEKSSQLRRSTACSGALKMRIDNILREFFIVKHPFIHLYLYPFHPLSMSMTLSSF